MDYNSFCLSCDYEDGKEWAICPNCGSDQVTTVEVLEQKTYN